MTATRTILLSRILVGLAFAVALGCYAALPDPVPTHWNLAGKADGFTPKPVGPFVLPLAMLFVELVFGLLSRRAAAGSDRGEHDMAMGVVQLSVVAFLFVATVTTLLLGIGISLPLNRVLTPALGLLLLVLGIFMRKLRKNAFVGIRTPWTLANDEVWQRTHALGGRLFVLAGLFTMVGGSMGLDLLPILVALGTAAVAPAVYSFRLYRKVVGLKAPVGEG